MLFKHTRTKSEFPFSKAKSSIFQKPCEPPDSEICGMDYTENARRSSVGTVSMLAECQIKDENDPEVAEEQNKHNFEDKFLLDSLNDQKKLEAQMPEERSAICSKCSEIKHEQIPKAPDQFFMQALKTAIEHFELESDETSNKNRMQHDNIVSKNTLQKQSPVSSYNISTTANSTLEQKKELEDDPTEIDNLRKEYNSLLAKYNEIKISNKNLLCDFTVIRNQVEEMNSIKLAYEAEIQQLQQQVCEAEIRLSHTTELYNKEKLEKENNVIAFKRILETVATTVNKPQNSPKNYSTLISNNKNQEAQRNWINQEDSTLEHIKKLEEDFALKEKEIKMIKAKIQLDKCSKEHRISPSYSPNSNAIFQGDFRLKSSPSVIKPKNICKASNAGRLMTETGCETLAQKPHASQYGPSVKKNIYFPGKFGISPKINQQIQIQNRSPSS